MTTGDRILVLDSGPAIALDQLDYARVLAEQDDLTLALSPVVVNELTRKPGAPGSAVPGMAHTLLPPEEAVASVMNDPRRPRGLHAGELETIALAEYQGMVATAAQVTAVIDESAARSFAQHRGLTPPQRLTGTLGLLHLVHVRGLNRRGLEQEIGVLRGSGYRLAPRLAETFVRQTRQELNAARARQEARYRATLSSRGRHRSRGPVRRAPDPRRGRGIGD